MAQGYYTLEESAKILEMSPDELKQLARKGEIRSFQDRGTWRFRIQDIQEMSRRRTGGSDLEMAVGEPLTPRPTDSPAPRSPKPQKKADDVFGFALAPEEPEDAGINLGSSLHLDKATGSTSGRKTGSSRRVTQAASDSEVRLVAEGSDVTFNVPTDSDVKLGSDSGPKSGAPRSSRTGMAGPKSSKSSKTKHSALAPEPVDSGVRLVPPDSDSDVRIVGAEDADVQVPIAEQPIKGVTDSDIRLEGHIPLAGGSPSEGHLTEEIDLDEELKKDEARQQQSSAKPEFPKKSPFDLSQSELELTTLQEREQEQEQASETDSSSDFELTPAAESSSPLELGSSDDFKLQGQDDDAITLGDDSELNTNAPLSGINLGNPADSGISLEQPAEVAPEDEFELTLDAGNTPKPGKPSTPQPGSGRLVEAEDDSDSSEFELSLDADAAAAPDADSEFELTLDDTGGLAAVEEEATEKDIFETDFDVPGLEDESGSEAVAVEEADTDLASSDFELGIDDEDAVAVDESGSEVVAIDEDAVVDEDGEPVSTRKRGGKRGADDEYADLDEGGDEIVIEEEEDAGQAVVTVQQAPWGIFPVAVLVPCIIVMALVGMMGIELVQAQQGYKPGMLTKAISGMIDGKK